MITKSTISFSILFSVFLLSSRNGIAQDKTRLYFLADTINVNKNNQILLVGHEGRGRYYEFFCYCLPPYNAIGPLPVTFGYLQDPQGAIDIQSRKPEYNYMSWKDFSTLLSKVKYTFDEKYELYITEVLPGKKYKTNKVRMTVYKDSIQ